MILHYMILSVRLYYDNLTPLQISIFLQYLEKIAVATSKGDPVEIKDLLKDVAAFLSDYNIPINQDIIDQIEKL